MTRLAVLFLASQAFVPREPFSFHHRSGGAEKAYILETMGSGVALLDYDGDGDLDVYLVNAGDVTPAIRGEGNRLFKNDGGWRFTDVTEPAGIGDDGFGQGVAVADVDNDGDADVYVTNYGANALYVNRGDGTFERRVSGVEDVRWSASAAFADVDGDGFVDLYVANYLGFDRELLDRLVPRRFCDWKGLEVNCGPRGFPFVSGALYLNRGDGTFDDRTAVSGLERLDAYQLGVVFTDVDLDSDPDLYVAADSTPNLLFLNRGDGTFEDASLLSGAAFSHLGAEQAGMGVDAGDVDGDGHPDLIVTNFSDDYNTLYRSRGAGRFEDATDVAGLATASLPYLGWSVLLEDWDADRDLDIFLVNGHVYPQVDAAGAPAGESFRQPMQLFWNDGEGRFVEAAAPVAAPAVGRGAALGDLDGDGDSDVVVSVLDGAPVALENVASRPWVSLTLVGRTANRDGLGSLVRFGSGARREVRASRGYLSSSDPTVRVPFAGENVVVVVVEWPNGTTRRMTFEAPGGYAVIEGAASPIGFEVEELDGAPAGEKDRGGAER